ncbi:endospore germination permease [Paenibacillus sp. GP183]|uniref:GerAB/ArcD/ProY family transporter n=1 Tax=Paenibacillus sp. GP183 TaxID=1882751 RepID=UPI000897F766|nr:endospore germination permease [Paenibacillus sp. GP183]SEC14606.1 spore germination protein (amino acid permease) [Paenibacillus sp. GP183]
MDHEQILNQRQLGWLTASIISSVGMMFLQNVLIRISESDAWLSFLIPMIYIFLIAAFFAYLAKRFPRKHIFEISMLLLGRWGGTFINVLMLFHFWMILMRDISLYSKFTSTILLERTPFEVLTLLPCLVLMYYGRTSIEVTARVNDIFYPLFFVSIAMMPILLSNEMSPGLLRPALSMPPLNILKGNFLAFGGAGDVFVLGAFLHTLSNSNQIRSSIRHGAFLGTGLLITSTLMIIMVLGPKMPGNFLYPGFNLAQMVQITDFLDRLDLIMLIVWYPTLMCKMLTAYLALLIGISSLLKERNYPIFNKPAALFVAITSLFSFQSATDLFSYSNYSSAVITLGYQPYVMIILMIAVRTRKRQLSENEQRSETVPTTKTSTGKAPGSWLSRLSYKSWLRISNGLLALSFILAAIGLFYGRTRPSLGFAFAAGYLLCQALLIWSTYREVTKLKQIEKMKNVPAASADTNM